MLIPKRVCLPPVEDCRGTSPSHQAQAIKPKPCSKVPGFGELLCVSGSCSKRTRAERADARNAHQPSGDFVMTDGRLDLPRNGDDPFLRAAKVVEQIANKTSDRRGEIILIVSQNTWKIQSGNADPLTYGGAVFQTEGAHLADQTGSGRTQLSADAMQGLHVHLLGTLDLDVSHRRPSDRLGYRGGVDHVVLVGLNLRLDELRRQDSNRVTHRLDLARQPLRAWTGLHSDDR